MYSPLKAKPIPIDWNNNLPIFAADRFLKSVGDYYGWLGGFDESEQLRCILPYTEIRKGIFKLIRFRVETIPVGDGLTILEEKSFLNCCIKYFRSIGADVIIPATTNSIFRTFPDGADAAPYGSYVIDLEQPEEVLWKNISRITRQNIGTAQRAGMSVRTGTEHLDAAHALITETFQKIRTSVHGARVASTFR